MSREKKEKVCLHSKFDSFLFFVCYWRGRFSVMFSNSHAQSVFWGLVKVNLCFYEQGYEKNKFGINLEENNKIFTTSFTPHTAHLS